MSNKQAHSQDFPSAGANNFGTGAEQTLYFETEFEALHVKNVKFLVRCEIAFDIAINVIF